MTDEMPIFECAENDGDFCQRARLVHDIEADKILRDDLGNRRDRPAAFVRHKRRHAMLRAGFQIQRGVRHIAEHGAGGGVLARAAPVKERVADNVAAHEHRVENVIHARENMRIRNQRRINGHLRDGDSPLGSF